MLDSTLIMLMGDNGFQFGEHGLIDKRNAYEESMRVPLVAQCPELFKPGTVVSLNGRKPGYRPVDSGGRWIAGAGQSGRKRVSFRFAEGKNAPWRDKLLYEYYWERNYPQTPAMHALRVPDQYKYIHYYGIWDTDELYDIQNDPHETKNLIRDPAHKLIVKELNKEMFAELEATDGMYIPLQPDAGEQNNLRRTDGSHAADFPPYLYRDVNPSNDQAPKLPVNLK